MMRLSQIFLVGTLLYGALSGLQCHYGLLDTVQDALSSSQLIPLHPRQQAEQAEQSEAAVRDLKFKTTINSVPSINDYVQKAIKSREQLAILYWNSSGQLDLPPLVEQCQFRNYTEAGLWPFYLQNLRLAANKPKLALYPTSDLVEYGHYNWSVPAPIPLIAHTLPIEIANNLVKYPWIRFFPTPYELRGDGKRWVDRVLTHKGPPFNIPFHQRKSQLVFRGFKENEKKPFKQRTRVYEMGRLEGNRHWLNATDEKGMPQREQLLFKYILDIGGISGTTWTAMRWKLCSKSLVFKVETGYADWWHHMLRPFEHYVPVKIDLSDLKQQWEWAENHPILAQKMAQNGYEVCMKTTPMDYLRKYTLGQIQSMPSPSDAQMGQYYGLLENSRKRLQENKHPLLFRKDFRFSMKQKFQCPPELSPDNI